MLYKFINLKRLYTLKAFISLPVRVWSPYHFSQLIGSRINSSVVDLSITSRQLRLCFSLLSSVFSLHCSIWLYNLSNEAVNSKVKIFKDSVSNWDETPDPRVLRLKTVKRPLLLPKLLDVGLEVYNWVPGLLSNLTLITDNNFLNREYLFSKLRQRKDLIYKTISPKSILLKRRSTNLRRFYFSRRISVVPLTRNKRWTYIRRNKFFRRKLHLANVLARRKYAKGFNGFKRFRKKFLDKTFNYYLKSFRLTRRGFFQRTRIKKRMRATAIKNKRLRKKRLFTKQYRRMHSRPSTLEIKLANLYFFKKNLLAAFRMKYLRLKKFKKTNPSIVNLFLDSKSRSFKFPSYNLVLQHDKTLDLSLKMLRYTHKRTTLTRFKYFKALKYLNLVNVVKPNSIYLPRIKKTVKRNIAVAVLGVRRKAYTRYLLVSSVLARASFRLLRGLFIPYNSFKTYFRSKLFFKLEKFRSPYQRKRKRILRGLRRKNKRTRTRRTRKNNKLRIKGKNNRRRIKRIRRQKIRSIRNMLRRRLRRPWTSQYRLFRRRRNRRYSIRSAFSVVANKKIGLLRKRRRSKLIRRIRIKNRFRYNHNNFLRFKKIMSLYVPKVTRKIYYKIHANKKNNFRLKLLSVLYRWRLNLNLCLRSIIDVRTFKCATSKLPYYTIKHSTISRNLNKPSVLTFLKRSKFYKKIFRSLFRISRPSQYSGRYHSSVNSRLLTGRREHYLRANKLVEQSNLASFNHVITHNTIRSKGKKRLVYRHMRINKQLKFAKSYSFSRFVPIKVKPSRCSKKIYNKFETSYKKEVPFIPFYSTFNTLRLDKKYIREYFAKKRKSYFVEPYTYYPEPPDKFLRYERGFKPIPSALVLSRLNRLTFNAINEAQAVRIPCIYFSTPNVQPFTPYTVLINDHFQVTTYIKKLIFLVYAQSKVSMLHRSMQVLY